MVDGRYEWSVIADVSLRPDRDAALCEGEANACLIAAAPDLLAVAQLLVRVAREQSLNLGPLIGDAEEAIARATTGGAG